MKTFGSYQILSIKFLKKVFNEQAERRVAFRLSLMMSSSENEDIIVPDESSQHSSSSDRENQKYLNKKHKKLFFTTSDLMNKMNSILQEDCPEAEIQLQRRMPNGSTRRADESDMDVANLQSKLTQAAKLTTEMDAPTRRQWTLQQRELANDFFHIEEYKEAMDIYLTCLVGLRGEDEDPRDFRVHKVARPVLMNLALCALRLKMAKKVVKFCEEALALESGDETIEKGNVVLNNSQDYYASKIFLRRGQARMLMGEYKLSRRDLEKALNILDLYKCSSKITEGQHINGLNKKKDVDFVKREIQKLDLLEKSGAKNKKRCTKAMQVLIGGAKNDTTDDNKKSAKNVTATYCNDGLYEDQRRKKTHSTLRARRIPHHRSLNNYPRKRDVHLKKGSNSLDKSGNMITKNLNSWMKSFILFAARCWSITIGLMLNYVEKLSGKTPNNN